MSAIRVGTFNVENLLQRFDFYRYGRLTTERALAVLGVEEGQEDYFTLRRALSVTQTDDTRQMTAQAIRDSQADVLCIQEVDNLDVLNAFHQQYVRKSTDVHYGWRRLIEGNDNRGIDVAVMARDWIQVTSHAHHTFHDFNLFNHDLEDYGLSPGDRIFRRDCLEVETNANGSDFFIFVCHFKSMSGGRDETMPVLIELWRHHFQPEPLFADGFSVNLVQNLPVPDRWTHFYPTEQKFSQLDYLLASPSLAQKNQGVQPDIVRSGQPYRVPNTANVHRYPRVGFDRPKASDHCPVAVTLSV